MKSILLSVLVMFSVSSFAASTASLGESLSPEDCVATAADKARAAKEFAAVMDDKKLDKDGAQTSEK